MQLGLLNQARKRVSPVEYAFGFPLSVPGCLLKGEDLPASKMRDFITVDPTPPHLPCIPVNDKIVPAGFIHVIVHQLHLGKGPLDHRCTGVYKVIKQTRNSMRIKVGECRETIPHSWTGSIYTEDGCLLK